jgi:RNA polymerase sigma-70 factor (ECF subfamily)
MDADEPRESSAFPATHWTKVYLASEHEQEAGSRALADLLNSYRPALRQYLRHRYKNFPPEETDDWISSFIEKKVLQQHLLQNANKDKGKFRNYVLTALYHFAEDQRRSKDRMKRQPAGGMVAYEESHNQMAHPGNSHPNPGDLRWVTQVIEQARKRTEAFYRGKGRDETWAVFSEGCFLPLHHGEERPSDTELARRHGLESARQVSNTITNAKRRFGGFLREVVREYEQSDGTVNDEIRELIAIVSDGH